jgi:hypothetical protein
MRLRLFVVGLILLFAGLALTGVSRNPTPVTGNELQKIAEGVRDVPEVSNVNLTKGEIFLARYSGGGAYVDPNEVIVNVYDPYGNVTAGISYAFQFQHGILANYTGPYTIQVGAPGLLDPSSPLIIVIWEMIPTTRVEYPNSNLFPFGLASILIGAFLTAFSASSKPKQPRKTRKTT